MRSRTCLLAAVGFGVATLTVVDVKADPDSARLEIAKATWTPLKNGNDSSQLFIDVTSIRKWEKPERYAFDVLLVPKPHTLDAEKKKPFRFEVMEDRFNCQQGTASKVQLRRYYEDGTSEGYWPWGLAAPWRSIEPGAAIDSEMKFVCALLLTSDSPVAVKVGSQRIFGTWKFEGTWQLEGLGRQVSGPIAISETQVAWTEEGKDTCAINYQIASRGTGSTFPGGPVASDSPGDAYTTYVLQFGPHTCAPGARFLTVSFPSGRVNFAYVTGFYLQAGTMRRVLPKE
jgi:hypothetical protein